MPYSMKQIGCDPARFKGMSERQRNELAPRRQVFVRSQQVWVNDLNSIPKFDGMPPH